MAKTTTTLSGPIGTSDWMIQLANMAGLQANDDIVLGTAPNQETARALVVPSPSNPSIIVLRGARGTNGLTYAGGATAVFGRPTDWGPGGGPVFGVQSVEDAELSPYLAEIEGKRHEADVKEAEALKKKADEEAAKEAEKAAKAEAKAKADAEKEHEANSKTASHTAHK
jgi:hypothetical protein